MAASPFASPPVDLSILLTASAELQNLASRVSPDCNSRQLGKCLSLLRDILEELNESAAGACEKDLAHLSDAVQSTARLLQLVAGAGAVAAVLTSRYSSRFQAVADELRQALSGLLGDERDLSGDTVENIKHLQRKLAQAKFCGDPNEDRALNEIMLHATLLELGRSSPQEGAKSIWNAICSALNRELSPAEIKASIAAISCSVATDQAFSSASQQRMLLHLTNALALQINAPVSASDNENVALLHNLPLGLDQKPSYSLPASQGKEDWQQLLRYASDDSASTPLPLTSRTATSNEDFSTGTTGHSSMSSANPLLGSLASLMPGQQRQSMEKQQSLTARPTMERAPSSKSIPPPSPSMRTRSGGAATPSDSQDLGALDGKQGLSHRASSKEDFVPPSLQAMIEGSAPAADWVISPEDLIICKDDEGTDILLGKGGFGSVFKAMIYGVEPVALKILGSRDAQPDPEVQARATRELELLRDCRNPNIVQFLGASILSSDIAIVTELMPMGDLHTALASNSVRWGPRALRIARDVARGLAFLHRRKIAHLDLKSPNILLGRDYIAKIADVGIARVLSGTYMTNVTSIGTFSWAAPELLMGAQVTVMADIYSFGVVLWELVTGDQPRRGGLRKLRVGEECSEAVNNLVNACLDMEVSQRPDARSVVHRLDVIISELDPAHKAPAPASSGLGKPRASFSEPPLQEPLAPARSAFHETAQGLAGSAPLSADSLRRVSSASAGSSGRSDRMTLQPSGGSYAESARKLSADSQDVDTESIFSTEQDCLSEAGSTASRSSRTIRVYRRHLVIMQIPDSASSEFEAPGNPAPAPDQLPVTNNARLEKDLHALCSSGCTRKDFSLDERGLKETETHAVAIMLAHNQSLDRFSFTRNLPDDRGTNRLMAAMRRNKTLKSLDLGYCYLGKNGGREVAAMLKKNASLQELGMFNTGLRGEGILHIMKALHQNTTLQKLDLGSNELGPEVGREVAEMLRHNRGLVSLDLRANRLGKNGLLAIAEGVQSNAALRTLKLSNNDTSLFTGLAPIKALLKQKAKQNGLNATLS